jgi:Fe-S-cluster containining protein
MKRKRTLGERFPPSEPCACDTCVGYCARPGWWSVEEAGRAIEAGYASRMMLEMSPDLTFGVLSPAFKGGEVDFANKLLASRGCTFLAGGRCELHGTGVQPLECRHCHHARHGAGPRCHAALEQDWNTHRGRALVSRWGQRTWFWRRLRAQHGIPPPSDGRR